MQLEKSRLFPVLCSSILLICLLPALATAQPIRRVANRVFAAQGTLDDFFGNAVAAYAGTLVVGAPFVDAGAPDTGTAYIFEQDDQSTWQQVAELVPADVMSRDFAGNAVAVEGDTAIVGMGFGLREGAVWVFERDAGGVGQWGETARLHASDAVPGAQDIFGWSVALSGNTIAVGSLLDDTNAGQSGSVFIFERDPQTPGSWQETAKLVPAAVASTAHFGHAVALDGDLLVVGANQEGKAYVFERDALDNTVWHERTTLVPTGPGNFGLAVAVGGDRIAVGAGSLDSVYLFERGLGLWEEATPLHAPTTGGYFGVSVDLEGEYLLIGAMWDSRFLSRAGAAYLYRQEAGVWTPSSTIVSSVPEADADFGGSVALDGELAVIGARMGSGGQEDVLTGAVYLMPIPETIFADGFESGGFLAWSLSPSGDQGGETL